MPDLSEIALIENIIPKDLIRMVWHMVPRKMQIEWDAKGHELHILMGYKNDLGFYIIDNSHSNPRLLFAEQTSGHW